jgi:hypothetical protein
VLTIDNSDFGVVEEGAWAGMIKVSQVKGSKKLQIWTDVARMSILRTKFDYGKIGLFEEDPLGK